MPRIEYEDIVSGQGTLNKDVAKKHDSRGGIAFAPDDVLYGKLRPYLRNWLNPQFAGFALGDFWVLNPTSFNPGYLFNLIRTPAFERVANESAGTKMPRADWGNVSNAEFAIPLSEKEQKQIGVFFGYHLPSFPFPLTLMIVENRTESGKGCKFGLCSGQEHQHAPLSD